jgi:hypothetical protein
MNRVIAFLLFNFIFQFSAFADEKAVKKYRNYTPDQIKSLPEKILQNDLPANFQFAAELGLTKGSEVLFAMQLNQLMYPGMGDYKAAVKAFQIDLGDAPSGLLTVSQIDSLGQRSSMQKLSRILFSAEFSSRKSNDSAFVQGTMKILDDKIYLPINHVKLRCWRQANYCEFDQISIAVLNKDSWPQSYQVIEHGTEYLKISRWDEDSIDAVPQETTTVCRTVSFNLNFKTREFFYITRNGGGDCEILGTILDKLPKPRISQIVDGTKIIGEEFGQIEKSAYEMLASDFRKKMAKMVAEEQKKK